MINPTWSTNIPTKSHYHMTCAKATDEEIDRLQTLLNELECFGQYGAEELDKETYPMLNKIFDSWSWGDGISDKDSQFMVFESICNWFANARWQVVLSNLNILRYNMQDPNSDILAFKPEISEGLALIDENHSLELQHEAFSNHWAS